VRLLTTAAQARPGNSDPQPPWMRSQTLTSLLSATPVVWAQRYRYPDTAAAKEISGNQIAALRRLRANSAAYANLLVEPDQARKAWQAALARASSGGWRRREGAWRSFLEPQQSELTAILRDKITLIVTPRVVTSARQGLFPVTIRNTLPPPTDGSLANAVRVRVEFRSTNSQRLTVDPVDVTDIPAGQSFAGTTAVRAQSNGTVRVVAQVLTVSGQPVGQPVPIDVKATQAGTIGWLIAGGAFAVLLGTTALRIRQVARERSRAGAAPTPGSLPHPAQTVPPPDQANQPEHFND
jgi:hypothetical protein